MDQPSPSSSSSCVPCPATGRSGPPSAPGWYRIATNKVIDSRCRTRTSPVPPEEAELPAAEDFVARIHDRPLLETIKSYVSGHRALMILLI